MTGRRLALLAMAAGVMLLVSRWGSVSDLAEALVRREDHVRRKKVVYWTSSGSPEVDYKRAREFMRLHRDTHVRPNIRETGGLQDIIFASFLSGNPPDVLNAKVSDVREMVVTGKVLPLDDLLADQLEADPDFLDRFLLGADQVYRFGVNPDDRFLREMDRYPRQAARLLKMNGKVLGFRHITLPSTLTYNKRVFRAAARRFPDAGLLDEHGEPAAPATWLELYEKAKLITEHGRRAAREKGLDTPLCFGLVIQGQRAYDLMRGIRPLANRAGSSGFNFRGRNWLADLPGRALDAWRGRRVGYFEYEHPAFLGAFALLRKLKDDGCILPGAESRHYEDVRTELASGAAGMLLDGYHAALIGAERVPWAAQDLGSAPVPIPYRDAAEKRKLSRLLGLDEAGIDLPGPNKIPPTMLAQFTVIASPSKHPAAAWRWMHFARTNLDIVKTECRRGVVPTRRDVRVHLGDPDWFPYPYQAQVLDILERHCEMWPIAPVHGPVHVLKNDQVFRKWFYQTDVRDLPAILRAARREVARFSAAANEELARRIAQGIARPESWTFEDWDPARGSVFFRRQQQASRQAGLKARLDDAARRLERLHPGLLAATTHRYQPPETPWQVLWIPGMLLAVVVCWLAWAAVGDLRARRPVLAETLRQARRGRHAYALVLPGLLALFAFVMYPSLYQLYLSVHRGTGLAPLQYVGWENFRRILDVTCEHWDRPFWTKVLPNTALYMLFVTAGQIGIGLLFASLLNMPLRANKVYRVLFFIPLVTSLAIVSVIFIGLLAGPDSGLNEALEFVGLGELPAWLGLVDAPGQRYDWLSGTGGPSWLRTDLMMVMFVGLWHGLPYNIILLLAGLQSISPDLYEAARVDGANAWKRFWHVTIPEMLPILVVIAFHALIGAARAFSVAYVLTEGGTNRSSELVATYIFKWGFTRPQGMDANIGYASALGVVYSALLAALSFVNVYLIARRWRRRLKVAHAPAGGPTDARR